MSASRWVVLTGSAGLVMAPGPDLSMPFNVITLTCTLVAFVVGTGMGVLGKKGGKKIKKDWDDMKELERNAGKPDGATKTPKLSLLRRIVNMFRKAAPDAAKEEKEREDLRASESENEKRERERGAVLDLGQVGTD